MAACLNRFIDHGLTIFKHWRYSLAAPSVDVR